jgi:hypothetical protein
VIDTTHTSPGEAASQIVAELRHAGLIR